MSTKVAINGLGRIGRAVLKLVLDEPTLELVAVNDLIDTDNLAYLLRFDTVYGRYERPVRVDGDDLVIAGRAIRTLHDRNPAGLPWRDLRVELLFECTGALTRREDLEQHIRAGARIVLLSAPSRSDDVETVVHGANIRGGTSTIISCASCTTNCITPIVEIVGRRIGVRKAMMTTVHAYTASQALVDGPSKRHRRGRAAAANLVPASTGAALATTRALPEYGGRFDGVAIRAPLPIGSIADITFVTSRPTSAAEVNAILSEEAGTARYAGVLGVSRDPLVSSDVIGDPRAAVVDLERTRVVDGDLVKVMGWYDNEWGYASQMVREAISMTGVQTARVR
ncbi:MAG: type I glyceraldehyde-3-phosphate dehydrogenase [Gemmatimonadaceae bacterium]|nr:type I glyceraldehyde-3-phosphate dehydrogenase [Gemmatimonadaceae bacterium]NUQ94894.1 type I glyceraldehyde-3-phosphate dehydrogenase [Gemmatimonadaceae bacterium]NUS96711.1 type I glyceraldehyde-3-phosphate dehydrogenase [Gemmatimonadaceae bacterium]